MIEVIFIFALIFIAFASLQDLKEREVANWLSFSLIIFVLGFRFFYSLFDSNWNFFIQGLIGLGIFFILGNAFYYMRVFAGGDAKLMIALGPIVFFYTNFMSNIKAMFYFILLFFLIGAIYSFIISLYLGIKNYSELKKNFSKVLKKNKKMNFVSILFAIVFALIGFYQAPFFIFAICFFIIPYFYAYAKSLDEASMIRKISVSKLREGDWLKKDVVVKGKKIKTTWDGLTKKDIDLLKKHKKNVLIRQGIAFVPVFFISFLFWTWLYFKGFF